MFASLCKCCIAADVTGPYCALPYFPLYLYWYTVGLLIINKARVSSNEVRVVNSLSGKSSG